MKIGVLHPGEMGISLCRALVDGGHDVLWVSEGRSVATLDRVTPLKSLHDMETLAVLCREAEGIVSVCPPHAAHALAAQVAACQFDGIYVDANAVSPDTAVATAQLIGAAYVDGGLIGPPADQVGSTRLYLAGARADEVADWFNGSMLEARAIGRQPMQASTLKMAYAAYTKGSSALLLAVNALAEAAGVRADLEKEWGLSQKGLVARSQNAAQGTSPKAWRFVGEMEEIAATFESFGLSGDFHRGAADLYSRMAHLKGHPPRDLEDVLRAILYDQED